MHFQNNDMMVDINIIFLGHGMMKVVTLPCHMNRDSLVVPTVVNVIRFSIYSCKHTIT